MFFCQGLLAVSVQSKKSPFLLSFCFFFFFFFSVILSERMKLKVKTHLFCGRFVIFNSNLLLALKFVGLSKFQLFSAKYGCRVARGL